MEWRVEGLEHFLGLINTFLTDSERGGSISVPNFVEIGQHQCEARAPLN